MNYKLQNSILAIILTLLIFSSCTQDKGPIEPEIEIATVSFENDIQPIFNANCTACHNTEASAVYGNLDLSEGNAYSELVGIISDGFSPAVLVDPSNPDASVLMGKIDESGDYGANMPLGISALSATDQEFISVWITEGALNN